MSAEAQILEMRKWPAIPGGAVEDHFPLSGTVGRITSAKDSDPEPPTAPTAGMWPGVKPTTTAKDGIDMDSVPDKPALPPRPAPRPSICPACGLTADNGITVHSELTSTATFVDTAGHIWAVTWMAVA